MLNADLQDLARRWGASDVPFTHEVDAWVDAPELVLLRRHLDHAAALRTPVLLSGPNGVGKSALVGRWMRGLDNRIHLPLALTHATLIPNHHIYR
jgi:DNA-binding NtrC family response regulator